MMGRRLVAVAQMLVVVPSVLFRIAQPPAVSQTLEYEVKAAYLLNFLGYAEWPAAAFAGADDPLRICIAARDPFGDAIDRVMAGEEIGGRPIVVNRLTAAASAERCALLFVPESVAPDPWLGRAGVHTLTVGESSGFIERGGIIELAVDAGRVQFDVNVGAASSRDIRLSSRLLRLARATLGVPD